jgi:Tat protein secretion system quality control protein TatD with DNase activity
VLCICAQAANDKLARTTAYLEEEKARAEALLYRMSGLIACFPCGPGEKDSQQLAAMAECQTQAAQLVERGTNASTTSALGECGLYC